MKKPICTFIKCRSNCRYVFIFNKYPSYYYVVQKVLYGNVYYPYTTYKISYNNLSTFISTVVALY